MPDIRNRMDQDGTQTMERAGQSSSGMQGDHRAQNKQGARQREASEHSEGSVARAIEQQTAKLPSDTFLWAACGCMGASALLQLMGKQHCSLFVGQWVAPMLLFGIYNKIVKVAGSDRATVQA